MKEWQANFLFQIIFKVICGYIAYQLVGWAIHKYDWRTLVCLYAFWYTFWTSKLTFK